MQVEKANQFRIILECVNLFSERIDITFKAEKQILLWRMNVDCILSAYYTRTWRFFAVRCLTNH